MSTLNLKYYLIVESGCQWYSSLVKCNNFNVIDEYQIDQINGDFMNNIYARDMAFEYQKFEGSRGGQHFYGWSISKKEFDRIKRLIELRPLVDEYNNLIEYK